MPRWVTAQEMREMLADQAEESRHTNAYRVVVSIPELHRMLCSALPGAMGLGEEIDSEDDASNEALRVWWALFGLLPQRLRIDTTKAILHEYGRMPAGPWGDA